MFFHNKHHKTKPDKYKLTHSTYYIIIDISGRKQLEQNIPIFWHLYLFDQFFGVVKAMLHIMTLCGLPYLSIYQKSHKLNQILQPHNTKWTHKHKMN